jgi:hypothetical protein
MAAGSNFVTNGLAVPRSYRARRYDAEAELRWHLIGVAEQLREQRFNRKRPFAPTGGGLIL